MDRTIFEFQLSLEDKYKPYIHELILITTSEFSIQIAMLKLHCDWTGRGIGGKIMQDICDYADSKDLYIELTASSSFGVSTISLYNFYTSFGFIKGKNKYGRNPR